MAGKKQIDLDWSKLEGMLLFDATIHVCAKELGCSHDTLERRIKEKYGETFAEHKEKILEHTVLKLKTKMINKALGGDNTCLIFCLKNLGKWADKVEHGFDKDKKTILLKYNLDEPKDVTPVSKDDNSSD
jgi:hypothetical protein